MTTMQQIETMINVNYEEDILDESSDNDLGLESIQNFAHNPMMERVQRALKEQLQNTFDRIKRDCQEQQLELRNAKKDREDCGVELYGMQQQLARLQCNLDNTEHDFQSLYQSRAKDETKIDDVKNEFKGTKGKLDIVSRDIVRRKIELDEVSSSTKQARLFNQETKDEVAISRRAASKAGETVKYLQKDKLEQDLYIDHLHKRVKSLEDDTKITEKQLIVQRKLTIDADKVAKETISDLESLVFEKKQLVQQWDSSILALGRRDQALTAAANALKKVKDSTKDRGSEILGLTREIRQVNEERETLQLRRGKLQNEVQYIEEQIKKIDHEQEMSAERFEILSGSISKIAEQEAMLNNAIKKKKSETSSLTQMIEKVTKDRKEFEERIGVQKFDQKSISQVMINLKKKEREVAKRIHEIEIDTANIQNEIARLNIDGLNTEAHTSKLQERLKEEQQILDEMDIKISKIETEIRRRHNEIESKMSKVDRLNRKYEQLFDGIEEEEPSGPLESTIKALEKEIESLDNVIQNQQTNWVANQTRLIELIGNTENMESTKREVSATLTILQQKRLRLIQNINTNDAALKMVLSRVNNMHTDMSRLNELIGKNVKVQKELENDNGVKRMEFCHEVKELQEESNRIESKIQEMHKAKEDILNDIIEVEKQILVWEKKIQLEKETQETLKSSENAHEAKGMEKEIHRMQQTLEGLKRDQEKLIREMELAIHKKEDIAVKYQYAKFGNFRDSNEITIAELRKKKRVLMKEKSENEKEMKKIINLGEQMRQKETDMNVEVAIAKKKLVMAKDEVEAMQKEMNLRLFEKQRILAKNNRHNALLKKHVDLSNGLIDLVNYKTEQVSVEQRQETVRDKIKRLQNVVAGMRMHYPKYEEVFRRVNILIEDN